MLKDNWLERQLQTVRELVKQGSGHVKDNKLVQADKNFREAEIILDSAENVTEGVLELKSVVFNEMGVIATRVNDARKALSYHEKAIAVLEQLAEITENDITARLAGSRLNLGGIYAAVGRNDDAEAQNRSALELIKDRDDESAQLMRIGARQNLGTLLLSQGRKEDGVAAFEAMNADVDKLAESGGPDVQFSLVQMLLNSAVARLRVDLADSAVGTGEKAAEIASALYEKTHADAVLQQVVNCHMNLVGIYEQARVFDKAENSLFHVLEIVPGHPEVVKRGQEFYKAILALGDDVLEAGGLPRDEAEESLAEVSAMLKG